MMKKLIVIEDDEILAENIKLLFESEGYSVSVACDGMEGLEVIKSTNPDIIICDINMPRMSGFKLKEELNKSKKLSNIQLIFLTAKTQISDLREGMGLGADDYIFKPYSSDELLKIVKLRLDKRERIIEDIKFSFAEAKSNRYKISDTFLVKGNKKSRIVRIAKIKLILADAQYSQIILENNKKITMRISLNQWEQKLPNEIFKRIHRSKIVNFNFVELLYLKANTHYLKLKNWDEKVSISRRRYNQLKL
jgi:DNA-binding response OmpR family regulator